MSTNFKCLQQMKCFTTRPEILHLIDSFTKYRQTAVELLDRIEQSIITGLVDSMPEQMWGLIKNHQQLTHNYLDSYLDFIKSGAVFQDSKIQTDLKKERKKLDAVTISYKGTLERQMKQLKELLQATKQFVDSKIDYNLPVTLQRLSKRDEGIALEQNGLIYEGITMFASTIKPKVDDLEIKGFHCPVLFDGVYFEQPFNSRNDPHMAIFRIHEGVNLRQSLAEIQVNMFHPEMKMANEHAYIIEFPKPVKLSAFRTYTLSAQGDMADYFATAQFVGKAEENMYVEFQARDYEESEFVLPDQVQVLHSMQDKGAFPAIICQTQGL